MLRRTRSDQKSHTVAAGRSTKWYSHLVTTAWQFLINLNIYFSYNPAIPFFSIYPSEIKTYVHAKTCTQIFTAVLFVIAKSWKLSAQLANELTLPCYSTMKKNSVLTHATIWIKLCSSGVPKGIFKFSDLLVEPTKFKRAILLIFSLLQQKDIN